METAAAQHLMTSDGRQIAIEECGDSTGFPIVQHHGSPGSRLFRHPDPQVHRGIRMITFDRPGYGGSDPLTGRDVAAVGKDVEVIADALGLERFGTVGLSVGGPHALATAAHLGDRLVGVVTIGSPAPHVDSEFDFFEGMSPEQVDGYRVAQQGRDADWADMKPIVEAITADPFRWVDQLASHMPEPDRLNLSRSDFGRMFALACEEGMRQGGEGWLDDDMAQVTAWGFELEAVTCPVRVLHGELDANVPLSHARFLAARLPNAVLEVVPGGGHGLADRWRAAYEWLASL